MLSLLSRRRLNNMRCCYVATYLTCCFISISAWVLKNLNLLNTIHQSIHINILDRITVKMIKMICECLLMVWSNPKGIVVILKWCCKLYFSVHCVWLWCWLSLGFNLNLRLISITLSKFCLLNYLVVNYVVFATLYCLVHYWCFSCICLRFVNLANH